MWPDSAANTTQAPSILLEWRPTAHSWQRRKQPLALNHQQQQTQMQTERHQPTRAPATRPRAAPAPTADSNRFANSKQVALGSHRPLQRTVQSSHHALESSKFSWLKDPGSLNSTGSLKELPQSM